MTRSECADDLEHQTVSASNDMIASADRKETSTSVARGCDLLTGDPPDTSAIARTIPT